MRTTRAATVVLGLAVLTAGCSDSGSDPGPGAAAGPPSSSATAPVSPPTAPSTTTTTRAPAQPASTRCRTADLELVLGPVDGAAGHRNGVVELVNASGRRCVVRGFGGLAFLDAGRRPLPIGITRDGPAPAPAVLAGRDAAAGTPIRWAVLPTGGTGDPASCPRPAYVAVIPPDETEPLTVRWPFGTVCGDTVSGKAYGVAE